MPAKNGPEHPVSLRKFSFEVALWLPPFRNGNFTWPSTPLKYVNPTLARVEEVVAAVVNSVTPQSRYHAATAGVTIVVAATFAVRPVEEIGATAKCQPRIPLARISSDPSFVLYLRACVVSART